MTSALASWLMLFSYFSSSSRQTLAKVKPESPARLIKTEPSDSETFDPYSMGDLSDTSRSFPTFGRQAPLHFSDRREARLKEEQREREALREEEQYTGLQATSRLPASASAAAAAVAEADDENENDDDDDDRFDLTAGSSGWRDSGIGTSLNEGTGTGTRVGRRQRRRKSFVYGTGEDL